MQSEPERELISSSLKSFESFVLLSRDVTALDREIRCVRLKAALRRMISV